MENMKYTEALKMIFKVMEGRPDIKEIKFNREDDSFDVISDTGVHVCFGDEFRDKQIRGSFVMLNGKEIALNAMNDLV